MGHGGTYGSRIDGWMGWDRGSVGVGWVGETDFFTERDLKPSFSSVVRASES